MKQSAFTQVAGLFMVFAACTARADIFQWEYINPADPNQGKQQSTTLAPDGAGVDAVPAANLSHRNLNMAYLFGADLTGANGQYANLTNAELSQANLTNSKFDGATLTSADFSGADLRNASFSGASLTDATFAGANVRAADFAKSCGGYICIPFGGITTAQLYSTASYQAHDLSEVNLSYN